MIFYTIKIIKNVFSLPFAFYVLVLYLCITDAKHIQHQFKENNLYYLIALFIQLAYIWNRLIEIIQMLFRIKRP